MSRKQFFPHLSLSVDSFRLYYRYRHLHQRSLNVTGLLHDKRPQQSPRDFVHRLLFSACVLRVIAEPFATDELRRRSTSGHANAAG
jgi:hypothetical protein